MAMTDEELRFIEHLVATSAVSYVAAGRLKAARLATGHPLDGVATELGVMREEALAKAMAAFFDYSAIDQPAAFADVARAHELGLGFLTANALLPLRLQDGGTAVAVADPFDSAGIQMIEYETGAPERTVIATRNSLLAAISALAAEAGDEIASPGPDGGPSEGDVERLRDFARQEPVVKFVSRVLQSASDAHASDIHIEPYEHEMRVRIRVDGALRIAETGPASLLPGVVTRIKILAGLDISERRLPQDGRMRASVRGQEMDLRVSISPVIHGETVVLRILDRATVALDLAALGFDPAARKTLGALARQPNGIVLITGPTGSGKTTTLYALLSLINSAAAKIFTVEDPVEYRLDGITQLQTNNAAGLTFARALRSILRQDPDIILIGEIRDRETADIAIQAALTGHLVLSTLHTNSAAGAITRLRDMGIEDYLIGATLKGVAAQRLLRKRCGCAEAPEGDVCLHCGGSGLSGRTVTHEICTVSEPLSRLICDGQDEAVLLEQMTMEGFTTLAANAAELVRTGVTTAAEAARVSLLPDGPGP